MAGRPGTARTALMHVLLLLSYAISASRIVRFTVAHSAPRGAADMKAPARLFQLSDWYGEDWDHKRPADDLWVSPWAKAHYKLRQQEIEIEQCEFLLQQAVEAEDFAEAGGLQTRVERLRSQHPIIPREQRLADALGEDNYVLAAVFQKDLDMVKTNLGLPKYVVGQAVEHMHRTGLRGVIIDVDLQCAKGKNWIEDAGCLERGCALGYPSDETDFGELRSWTNQPFYTVILDLASLEDEGATKEGVWRWRFPSEISAWEVNRFSKLPPPVYIAEDALVHDPDDQTDPTHPELWRLFKAYDTSPHRGRIYRPAPRLRLWQQQRAKELQEARRKNKKSSLGSKNPYDLMQ